MDNWIYTCVGCGEKNDVECINCGRKLFKGRKKDDVRWLECVHCKYENDEMLHVCDFTPEFRGEFIGDPYRPEVIHKQATTSINANRDFFYKVVYEENLNQSKRNDSFLTNTFLPIIVFVLFLGIIMVSLSQ